MDNSFGAYIASLRKESSLSQEALGDEIGVSQATISRLERSHEVPDDPRLIAKLGRAFDLGVRDFLADFEVPPGLTFHPGDMFYAFCPNPMCHTNQLKRGSDGSPGISWRSGGSHDVQDFAEINFCGACGTELVKQCPSCERPLRDAGAEYCVTCGAQLNDRPTAEEWTQIENELGPPPSSDGLPF